jgi:hypothetical protein
VRRPVTAADRGLIASHRSGRRRPLIDTDFTDPAELQSQWSLQSDDRWDLRSCGQPQSVVSSPAGLDGEPVVAIATPGAISKPIDIRFSPALAAFAGKIPDKLAGHIYVRSCGSTRCEPAPLECGV